MKKAPEGGYAAAAIEREREIIRAMSDWLASSEDIDSPSAWLAMSELAKAIGRKRLSIALADRYDMEGL